MKERYKIFSYGATCDDWYGRHNVKVMIPKSLADDKWLRQYKKAGFNLLFISYAFQLNGITDDFCESKLKKVMDLAWRKRLKCFIFEKNLHRLTSRKHSLINAENADGYNTFVDETALESYIRKCLEQVMKHPAFIGVSVKDEPSYDMFTAYGQVYKILKKIMPSMHINANIDMGLSEEKMIAEGKDLSNRFVVYKESLSLYSRSVKPSFIQFDCYPLRNKSDGEEFFPERNIVPYWIAVNCLVGDYCAENDIPFSEVFQASGFTCPAARWGCVAPRERDMYWQLNIAMSVGVSIFSYWTYFPVINTGGEYYDDESTIVDTFGRKNKLYYVLKRIHKKMQEIAGNLLDYKYCGAKIISAENIAGDTKHIDFVNQQIKEGFIKTGEYQEIKALSIDGNGAILITELHNKHNDDVAYYFTNITDPALENIQKVLVKFVGGRRIKPILNGRNSDCKLTGEEAVISLSAGEGAFVRLLSV